MISNLDSITKITKILKTRNFVSQFIVIPLKIPLFAFFEQLGPGFHAIFPATFFIVFACFSYVLLK